jgi:hypothetical protein
MNANSGIGRQRELAIGALLSSQTIEEAAKKIDRHERTLRRWLEQPSFRDAYLKPGADCASRRWQIDHGQFGR